ncbi:MAG: SRPBCC family protein [Flavobacteriaceae bacterium]
MSFCIEHDLFIQKSPVKIFQAISAPEHINQWWTQKCEGIPQLGSTYNLYFTETYNWWGEVTVCDTPHHFEIRMTVSDPDWNPTRFGFKLEAQQDKTLVHFYHKGWIENNHHFRYSSWCWALLLKGLKNYVEQGIVIPFEARN